MRAGMLGSRGNDGAPMTKRLAKKLDDNRLGGHALSPSQEPLPPYELDPMLDNPVIRNRIGELIAKAAEKRLVVGPYGVAEVAAVVVASVDTLAGAKSRVLR